MLFRSVLKRARCSQNAELHITGRDIEESRKALRFDTDTMTWEILGEADEVWQSHQRVEIISVLQKNGFSMRPREIADELGLPGPAVRKTLSRMARDNQIVWIDGGRYDLKPNDRRAYQDPAREERRKEKARVLQEAISEVMSVDESAFAGKWNEITEEVFERIERAYGVREVKIDAPPPWHVAQSSGLRSPPTHT